MLSLLFALVLNRKPVPLKGPPSIRRFAAEISPLAFCAKLAVVRVTVDVFFAVGHWVIHRPVLFHSETVGHHRHHEHIHPSVVTNQHFTIADLFVEAYLPAMVGIVGMQRGLGWKSNPLEEALLSGYIG
jgi:sterol desaturase/sphingolipid hydroxylase (fatty acid hydroxylase superfamily)